MGSPRASTPSAPMGCLSSQRSRWAATRWLPRGRVVGCLRTKSGRCARIGGDGRSPVFTLRENQAAAIGDVLLFPYCPLSDIVGVTSASALDGDLGEWSDFASATLDRDTAATIQGAPPERADLSGTLRWAWDAAGLYLAVHVTDDALIHDSPDLAQDDVFELAIDGDGDNAGGGPSDHLYRITHDGRQSDHGVATQALTVAARTVAGGWDLEIVIPAGQFAPGGLAPGRPIHFNWALADDDNGGSGDARLIAFGTQLDPPETAWRWATLSAGVRDFVGLFDPGRWEAVTPLPAASAPWYWDPLTGWRGEGAAMLRTTDGGATWQTAATGLPAVDAFQFVDARAGWAWHNGSHSLAHTTDGGRPGRRRAPARPRWRACNSSTSHRMGARRRRGTPPDGQWRPELAGSGARPNRRRFSIHRSSPRLDVRRAETWSNLPGLAGPGRRAH